MSLTAMTASAAPQAVVWPHAPEPGAMLAPQDDPAGVGLTGAAEVFEGGERLEVGSVQGLDL